jgi:broad specificity phosphatase PhoE
LIVLARHGESEYSARGLCNGDVTVAVGLTERGREESRRLGELLRDEPIELCVTSEFQRARETAEIALAGRDVPRLVVPELNDPVVGRYEGATVEEYRDWAGSTGSSAIPEPGGESRLALVLRYARGFRLLLARPKESVLAVCHSLPIAYALEARAGRAPAVRVPFAEHAMPYPFTREELGEATTLLEDWAAAPTW